MFGIKSRRQLQREVNALRQALLWYAAAETWLRKAIHQKGAPRKKWQKSPAAFDRGHFAIQVLTQLDEPRGSRLTVTVPAPLPVPAAKPTTSTLGDSERLSTTKE